MKKMIIIFFIIILLILLIAPFASTFPDGLEKVAELFNFSDSSKNIISPLIPDYSIPIIKNELFSTFFAGIIGIILTYLLIVLFSKIIKNKF